MSSMGLFFLLFGRYPLNSYLFNFLIYYNVNILTFFLLLIYLVIRQKSNKVRSIKFFSDFNLFQFNLFYQFIFYFIIF